MLKASLVSPARVSPTLVNWPLVLPPLAVLPMVPPVSRYRRAARQIGHHWHSGGSSVSSSVVAVSQMSDFAFEVAPPPRVVRTRPATSRPILRAPARISHRWKSPIGSLPCSVLMLLRLVPLGH
jgi:hypothetical protein